MPKACNDLNLSKTKMYGLNFLPKPHEGRECFGTAFTWDGEGYYFNKTFVKSFWRLNNQRGGLDFGSLGVILHLKPTLQIC